MVLVKLTIVGTNTSICGLDYSRSENICSMWNLNDSCVTFNSDK